MKSISRNRASSEGKYEGKARKAISVIDNDDLSFWYTDKVNLEWIC